MDSSDTQALLNAQIVPPTPIWPSWAQFPEDIVPTLLLYGVLYYFAWCFLVKK